jgi:hypothetical protein
MILVVTTCPLLLADKTLPFPDTDTGTIFFELHSFDRIYEINIYFFLHIYM